MNSTTIQILQIIVSLLLIVSILLQNRGGGLGSAFGGGGEIYRTKRGAEKLLFRGTLILGLIFIALAIAGLLAK